MKFELTTLDDYSDSALIAELQRVAETMQGQRLTRARFDSLSKVHSSTLHKRFGSWAAALDKAGISEAIAPKVKVLSRDDVIRELQAFAAENPGKSITMEGIAVRLGAHGPMLAKRFGKWEAMLAEVGLKPVPLGRRYSDEECFENILSLWTHYGRQPKFAELNRSPSQVGSKAYVSRWGGWRAALAGFVEQVNDAKFQSSPPNSVLNEEKSSEAASLPRSISLSLRYRVLVRDKFRCVICGASPAKDGTVELHIDHILPWSKGGSSAEENLRTLCFKCNLGKRALIIE